MSDKKNSNVIIISLIFIFLNATELFENQIGIVIFLTIYSYLLSEKIFTSYLVEKNSFGHVFFKNFINYYFSFLVAILTIMFIAFFQNPILYATLKTELYYIFSLTLHAKFLSTISFITILLSFNFMLHLVFYLMKKKFKSFNIYFIFLFTLTVAVVFSAIFLNTQFIYYLPLVAGSLYSFINDNKLLTKIKLILKRLRLISIALFILFVVLLYVFRNNIIILTILGLVLITIENSEYRLFKNKFIANLSVYSYTFVLVLYGVINLLIQSYNQITLIMTLIILFITILNTIIFYYLIFKPLSTNMKFRYFSYFITFYFIIMSVFMTTLNPPVNNTEDGLDYIEETNIITQDVDSLIEVTHDTYEASTHTNNISDKQIIYVGDSSADIINQATDVIFTNMTTDVSEENSYSNVLDILSGYDINEQTIIVLDISQEKLDYQLISDVIEAYPDNSIYLITTRGQEQLNTLLIRAEVEYSNVYVIDYAEHSSENEENYLNNSNELSKIGVSNYINYMYDEINVNEGE